MITPFAPLNRRRIRAEHRARLRRLALDLACLALLALVVVGTGHLILRTALELPHLAAQAEAMKGM